jgi:hypothetical protein
VAEGRERIGEGGVVMRKWVPFDDLPDVTQDDIASEIDERFGVYRAIDDLAGLVDPPMFLVHDMPISRIRGYHRNPSAGVVDKYRKMLESGSESPPILVDGNKFIDGGHRFAAYVAAGRKSIPVVDVGRLFKLWPEWAEGGANELERTASSLLKIARGIIGVRVTVDEAYVKGLKLMMARDIRNLERDINSPEDAERVRKLANDVSKKWERIFYEAILGKEMDRLSQGGKDMGYLAKELQSSAWLAVISFSDIGHHLAQWPKHWNKYYNDFDREKKYVFDRIKRAARQAYDDALWLVKNKPEEERTNNFGERATVGRFILVPEGGITEEKMEKAASLVRRSQSLVGRAGFRDVLSRMIVHVTSRSDHMKGGYYRPQNDDMAILPVGMSEETVIHELGHRKWYRFMSPGDRDYWTAAFNGDLVEITDGDVREITERVRRVWDGGGLSSTIKDAIADYERSHSNDPVATYKADYFRDHTHHHDNLDFWVKTWKEDLVGQKVMKNYVTDYANTNEVEAYAEVFRQYVLKKAIPAEVLYWFRRVTF